MVLLLKHICSACVCMCVCNSILYFAPLNNIKTNILIKKKAEELKVFQRRHTDGQQTHEKMLRFTNYQGNVSQNHTEKSPPPC